MPKKSQQNGPKAQSVNKKTCFREVQFFGTILWRELKSYQKITQLTERKKEQVAFMHNLLAARWWHQAWQRGGNAKLDSAATALGLTAQLHSAVSLGHGRASCHQRRAATTRRHGGNEDTGGDSDCGGTINQQSTKKTEATRMKATRMKVMTITIETKRGGSGQLGGSGGSLARVRR